ncbi:carbohydrate ABC transporter permease [Streptomyces sp. NPDC001508]|uniref:carbohydrate ABC transporter permease n=1 Tax=Streptomyces sp. NPDC001508 TaxID=3154656 RepID=UPI00331D41D4
MRRKLTVNLPGGTARPAKALRAPSTTPGRLVLHFALLLCALAFLAPLVVVLSSSFSSEEALSAHGYGLIPREFTVEAYRYVMHDPSRLVEAYAVSILVTCAGTALSMLVMSMLAYALSRKDFFAHRSLSFYVLFTMLFTGGLVPQYILMTRYLHLQNTLFALILPYAVVPWSVLLLRTYFRGIPRDVIDAARIDGAGELRTFFRVVVPLSGPALATIGMFTMLTYWNDWWLGLLYINDDKLNPVQLWLYRILSNVDAISSNQQLSQQASVPVQSLRMAVAVLAIGPIIGAFLFLQRYFVRGITVGGVRG